MGTDDPDDWMWERARSLLDSADLVQRRTFGVAPQGGRPPAFQPPIDVFETGRDLWVLVALPGVCADHVRVTVAVDHLEVDGHRTLPEVFRGADVHRLESPHGRFWRRIDLPSGRYALEQQELVQGCLVLRLCKLNPSEPSR